MNLHKIEVTVMVDAESYEDAKEDILFALQPMFSVVDIVNLTPFEDEPK